MTNTYRAWHRLCVFGVVGLLLAASVVGCVPYESAPPVLSPAAAGPELPVINVDKQYTGGQQDFWAVVAASPNINDGGLDATVSRALKKLQAKGMRPHWARSTQWSSLRPGYVVVFTGPYKNSRTAEKKLKAVKAAGFKTAYVRHFATGAGAAAPPMQPPVAKKPAPRPKAKSSGLPGDTNGDGKYVYPEIPPGANPSPEWTGKNTEWNYVQGYYRKDGTYVSGHYRRTK